MINFSRSNNGVVLDSASPKTRSLNVSHAISLFKKSSDSSNIKSAPFNIATGVSS